MKSFGEREVQLASFVTLFLITPFLNVAATLERLCNVK